MTEYIVYWTTKRLKSDLLQNKKHSFNDFIRAAAFAKSLQARNTEKEILVGKPIISEAA